MYVPPRVAARHYGVHVDTLRRWDRQGKIKVQRVQGGNRRYFIPDERTGRKIVYARVSSSKQKPHLLHQVAYLEKKYPSHKVITDIGSGINFRRPGFKTILDGVFERTIEEVVVSTRDRLARFGFDLLEDIFAKFGAHIRVDDTGPHRTPDEELANDLLSVVTVFTARHHGRRRYKTEDEGSDYPSDSHLSDG